MFAQDKNFKNRQLPQKYLIEANADNIQSFLNAKSQNLSEKDLLNKFKNAASLTASQRSVYLDMLKDISARKAEDILNIKTKMSSAQGTASEQSTISKSKLSGQYVLTEHEYFADFGGGFYFHDLFKYSYDNKLNLTQDLYQYYDSTAGWVNSNLMQYSYDSFNRDTLAVNQSWDTFDLIWLLISKYSNTYDANNNLLYTLNSQWANPGWVLSGRFLYTYDANNNTLERLSQWFDNPNWNNDSRATYTYDANNNLLTDIYETWNGTDWQKFTKFENTYDANNNVLSATFSIFGNYSYKDIYTYDSNNNQISDSNYNWDGANWVISFVQTSTYDVMNNQISYLMQQSNGTSLEDYLQYEATFNAFNNITSWRSYVFNSGNWLPARKAEYSYDANQNNTLVTDSSSRDGGLTWKLFSFQRMTWSAVATGIDEQLNSVADYKLSQNYPNPFNPSTSINFSIPNKANVSLKVFDLLGSQVAELVNGEIEAGSYNIEFNAANLPSGIYFYKIQSDNFSETRKMVLLK
jgi:hypothetical protein